MIDPVADSALDPTDDPTTAAIVALNDERDRLRAEAQRLSKALVEAYTTAEGVSADRDYLRAEVERLKKIGDTTFVKGYDQAVGEIRNHFSKAKDMETVAEIEKIWLAEKRS